jgi:hypothetical protein
MLTIILNLALRQRLLQLVDANISGLCIAEDQRFEAGHPFKMIPTSAVDLRTVEDQLLEVGQPFETFQPSAGDLGVVESQPF